MTRQQSSAALAAGGEYVHLCYRHLIPPVTITGLAAAGLCTRCGEPKTVAWDPTDTAEANVARLTYGTRPEVITVIPAHGFKRGPVPADRADKLRVIQLLIRRRAEIAGFEQALPDVVVIADGEWGIRLFGGEVGPVISR